MRHFHPRFLSLIHFNFKIALSHPNTKVLAGLCAMTISVRIRTQIWKDFRNTHTKAYNWIKRWSYFFWHTVNLIGWLVWYKNWFCQISKINIVYKLANSVVLRFLTTIHLKYLKRKHLMKTIDKCVPKLIIITIEYISGKPFRYTSYKLRKQMTPVTG